MTKQTMSEIVAAYNKLAVAQGKDEVSSFKNLSAARAALKSLESNTMTEQTETQVEDQATAEETTGAPGLDTPSNGGAKYNSSAKRGPTQGIGAFCKGLIAEGKTNVEILAAVAESFPTAKTTSNCVAYYRAKMAKAAAAMPADEAAGEDAAAEEATAE